MTLSETLKNKKSLIAFLTAGYPNLEKTKENMLALQRGGADIIIIGIPFSDPYMCSKNMQKANFQALLNGTTIDGVFDIIEKTKDSEKLKTLTTPVVLYSYINTIFVYGYDRFFTQCKDLGINGVLIPDLPFKERGEIYQAASENNVDIIPVITHLPEERLNTIIKSSEGFIYYIYPSNPGAEQNQETLKALSGMRKIKAVTDTPIAINCTALSPQQVKKYLQITDAIIVDDSIVDKIEEHTPNAEESLAQYMKVIKYSML